MAINPLQQPINYAVDVQSPFQAALGGIQLGAGVAELQAAQQKRELERNALVQAQQRQTDLANLYKNPNATSADYARVAAFLPKDQAAIVTQGFERKTKEQQQSDLRMGGEVYSAIKSGNLDVAKRRLTEKATALRNSGRENEAKAAEDSLELINLNPTGAQATIGLYMARLPGGKDFLDNADKALSTLRSEQLQPSALATAEAASTKAVAEAQKAFAEAEGTPQRLVAEQQLRDAQAGKAATEARVAQASERSTISEAAGKADKAVAEAQTAQATAANAAERATADAARAIADAQKAAADARVAQATEGTRIGKAASEADKTKVEAQFAGELARANLNLNAAQIKNITSQINDRAAKLKLDEQTMLATVAEKLAKVGEVPSDVRKLVNESAITAASSKQSAGQYNDLAKRLEAAGGGFGLATSFADYLSKATGSQSPLTELRQEYTRVRNSAAIKSLPPGVATDKDIELALKGIPPENANAGTIVSFLRGLAKMQDIDASVANAKTDWLASNNGTLTRAKNTFIAGDYSTKPGESFNDFTQRVVTDVAQKYRSPEQTAEARRQQAIGQIPTTAAPAAAPAAAVLVNIRAEADAILRGR